MFGTIAGHWSGKTRQRAAVKLDLLVQQGAVTGNMTVGSRTTRHGRRCRSSERCSPGRTVVFSVQPTGCEKSLTHGSVTFVARGHPRSSISSWTARRIRVTLSKVG